MTREVRRTGARSVAPHLVDLGDRLVHGAASSGRRLWWTVFGLLVLVYSATAHWYGVAVNDSIGTAWASWQIVHGGSLSFPPDAVVPAESWFQEVDGRYVSNRMPGIILMAVPAQFVLAPLGVHPLTPAVVTAVLTAALAMANMALLFSRLTGRPRLALAAAVALALGTGFWTNASAELWPHGPDALWLSLALLALSNGRLWWAGAALAPAIATRPHLAVVAAAIGVVVATRERQWRPLLAIGLPSSAGVVGLLAWNAALFGRWTVSGGYGWSVDRLTDTSPGWQEWVLDSAAGTFVSPLRGLFVMSPWLVVAAIALARGIPRAPAWVHGCALGALAYQVLQWRIGNFAGGSGFYSYRYVLEALVLCSPAALLGYLRWREDRPAVAVVTRALVGLSIGMHLVGAYWYQPLKPGTDPDPPRWTTSGYLDAALSRGTGLAVVALAVTCSVAALAVVRLRRPAVPVPPARPQACLSGAAPS